MTPFSRNYKALITPLLFLLATIRCTTMPTEYKTPTPEVLPIVGSIQAYRFQLPNRIRLIVIPDHSSPTLAYQTWFDVGSINEEKGKTGLAHLFEHMMFKGTHRFPDGQFDRMSEQAGAEGTNAFTSRDYTAYIQEVPSSEIETIAKLESDRMINLIVNDQSFATEREVVQNERRMRTENSPEGTLFQTLYESAFKEHAYHWPVIGYEEDLSRMTSKDAVNFYQTHYNPENAVIILAGDIEPSNAYELVNKYYGNIVTRNQKPRTLFTGDEPEQKDLRRTELKLNTQVEKLYMAFKIPPNLSHDLAGLEGARALLTSGKNNRLSRALVETGIVSSIGAFIDDSKAPSLFVITASLQTKRHAAEAEKIILRELKRLGESPPSESEWKKALRQIEFEFYQGFDTNAGRANFVGHYEIVSGRFSAALNRFQDILNTKPEEIRSSVYRYLNPSIRTVVIGVPK